METVRRALSLHPLGTPHLHIITMQVCAEGLTLPYRSSAPADMQQFQSPMRHHKRTPSAHRQVKVCPRPSRVDDVLADS